MPSRTFSSREFSQDAGRAKRAASDGPVFITDRGRPAHVLLTMDDYVRLTGASRSIVSLLAQAGGEEVEFEPPRLAGVLARPADLD